MSVELDNLAKKAEDAGFPTLAAGYRRDAQLIRELNGPEYFFQTVEPIGRLSAPADILAQLASNLTFGQLLREFRDREGVSEQDLASASGILRLHLNNFE